MLDPQKCCFFVDKKKKSEISFFKRNQKEREMEINEKLNSIEKFFSKQIDYFHKQMKSQKKYQLPNSYTFVHACYSIEELISFNLTNLNGKITQYLYPDEEFSKVRCQFGVKIAKENFVNEILKEDVLENSLKLYNLHACGIFENEYFKELKHELTKMKNQISIEKESNIFKFHSTDISSSALDGFPISHLEIKILKQKYSHKLGIEDNQFIKDSQYLNKMKDFYFGYEYLSKSGMKFFLPPPPSMEKSSSKISERDFLESDISLIMNSPSIFNLKDEDKVKLNQIYIVTPATDELFGFYPRVTFEHKGEEKVFSFLLRQQIVLPKDSFVVIQFHYVNVTEDLRKMRLKLLKNSIYSLK
jgi:hypothetical protein